MQVSLPGAARAALNDAPWPMIGMVGILAIVAAVPTIHMAKEWTAMRKDKEAWTIPGSPCATAPDGGQTRRAIRSFDYGGATFSRRAGHVYCATLGEGLNMDRATYPVCQFTGPVRVAVTTGGRTTYFNPGAGRPATIVVRDGRASCVEGGWFRG